MNDCWKSGSLVSFVVVLLSVTSGLPAFGVHPTSSQNPSASENPIVRIAKQPLDRGGRLLGIGWGDGYHACHGSGLRPGADLPPKSSHATRRRISRRGNTYYDRFDNHNLIHPRDYQAVGCSQLHSCDESSCDQYSFDETSQWNLSELNDDNDTDLSTAVASILDAPVRDVEALAKQEQEQDKTTNSETAASSVAHPIPRPTHLVEQELPPANQRPAQATSKPSRLPTVSEKPCRVAQAVPAPAPAPLAEQVPSRIAELPQWAIDDAESVQQNPFFR